MASIAAMASSLTDVDAPMMPPLREITFWQTSKTAITILKQLEMSVTATKVLNIHLKMIQVSKFAKLLCSMMSCISS